MVWRILLVATLAPSLVYCATDGVTSRPSYCLDELDKQFKKTDEGRGKRQDPLEYLIPALSPVCQNIVKQALVEVKHDRESESTHAENSPDQDLKLERSKCLEQLDKHYKLAGVRNKRQDPLEYLIPALTPVCQSMVKRAMKEVQRDKQLMKIAHSNSHLDDGDRRAKRYVRGEIPFLSDSFQGQQPTFSTVPSLGAGNPSLNLPPNSNSFPANVQLNVDRNNVQVRPQTAAPPTQMFLANAVTLNPPGDVVFPRPQPVNTFPQPNNFNRLPPNNFNQPPPNNFGRPPPNNFGRPPPNFQGRPPFGGRGNDFGFNNMPQRSIDLDQSFFRH